MTELREHLGLTRQRVGVPADIERVIERLPNGRFDLGASTAALFEKTVCGPK
jgi:hypothetical protein